MTTRIVQHGNELAVIIDPALLEKVGFTLDTPLEAYATEAGIVVSKKKPARTLDESIEWVLENYDETFRRLAD